MDHKLGRRPSAIFAGKKLDLLQILAVAAVHPHKKRPKCLDSDLRASLIDIVYHILIEQTEHGIGITGIEVSVVFF
jgi:hypothetical protein